MDIREGGLSLRIVYPTEPEAASQKESKLLKLMINNLLYNN